MSTDDSDIKYLAWARQQLSTRYTLFFLQPLLLDSATRTRHEPLDCNKAMRLRRERGSSDVAMA